MSSYETSHHCSSCKTDCDIDEPEFYPSEFTTKKGKQMSRTRVKGRCSNCQTSINKFAKRKKEEAQS